MANLNKNKKFEQTFMPAEGKLHRPKKVHVHIAREVLETHGPTEANEFVRRLMPDMQDRVLGYAPGTTKPKGWHPSGGRRLVEVERIRGGMIG